MQPSQPYSVRPHNLEAYVWRRIMQGSGVKRSRTGVHDTSRIERLEEFAAACAHVDFRPPLSARQALFLQDLQTQRVF